MLTQSVIQFLCVEKHKTYASFHYFTTYSSIEQNSKRKTVAS